MSRKPDWLSGTDRPRTADRASPPSVFDSRRTGGIVAKSRRPTISSGPTGLERVEEPRDLGRVVLAVRVQRHDRQRAGGQGVREPRSQGGALAGVRHLAQHRGAGTLRDPRRVIGRAVVDDDDRQGSARGLDDGGDPGRLIEGRDDREDRRVVAVHRGKYRAQTHSHDPLRNAGQCGRYDALRPKERPCKERPMTTDEHGPELDPPTGTAFSDRTAPPSRWRVALVGGAALALVAGGVATSLAASPAPSGIPTVPAAGALALDPGLGLEDDGTLDRGGVEGRGFRDITITAISGSDVTLGTADGWRRTIAVTDAIDLTKGGQDVSLGDLKVGDQVRFAQTRNADGTYTVTKLAIVVPTVRGTVSDVTADGFKVTTRDGSVWTIATNGTTTYRFGTADGHPCRRDRRRGGARGRVPPPAPTS